jgi:hypothetical protein
MKTTCFDLNIESRVDGVKRNEASEEVKKYVFHELLRRSTNGVLARKATREVAAMFNVMCKLFSDFERSHGFFCMATAYCAR